MSSPSLSISAFVKSSIGRKIIVAVTGLALVLFLLGHLSGNLLIYAGKDAFNEYAAFLHNLLHGVGIWIARLGLLACVVLHVLFTILLTRENREAKPRYAFDADVQATKSSKIMIWSGLTILAFVIFHLLHFTVRIGSDFDSYRDALGRHDAYRMVIVGFSNFFVVLFYIVAMTLLCSHLSHGVSSIFQTLGLRSQKTATAIDYLSKALALALYVGFISIPISIYLFGLGK